MSRKKLRCVSLFFFCIVCAAAIAQDRADGRVSSQTPVSEPSFEVATVKPVDPSYRFDGKRFWAHVNRAGVSFWYMNPTHLIEYAYNVQSFQVAGPEWTRTEHFDIEARFPEGADPKDNLRMLQSLLKDRFSLRLHVEKRELEGKALVVGGHGAKLTPSLPESTSPDANAPLNSGDGKIGEAPAKTNIIKNADGSSTVNLGQRGT